MITLRQQVDNLLAEITEKIEMEDCYKDEIAYKNLIIDIDNLKELVTEQYEWNKL